MKNNIVQKFSLRAKFKSFDTVEICITCAETGEVQLEEIPITLGKPFPNQEEVKQNTPDEVTEKSEHAEAETVERNVVDDTDGDENE